MKRILVAAIALVALAGPSLAGPTVVVSLNRDDFLQRTLADSAKAAVEAAGGAATIVFSGDDDAKQIEQIKAAIAGGANAVVLTAQTDHVSSAVQDLAAGPGIPVVFMNVMPTIDRFNAKTSAVISNDLVAGRLQMRYLAKLMGRKGTLALLVGDTDHPAGIGRTKGLKEVLAATPGISLVAEGVAGWSRDKAREVVTGWLKEGKRFTALAANNDEMAIGAAEALEAAGITKGSVAIAGVEATPQAIEAMGQGRIAFTIFQNARQQGAQSAANALALLEGKPVQLYDWVPYELVTSKTIAAYR